MPVAALVGDKIFYCHGGISPKLTSWEQIRCLLRPRELADEGLGRQSPGSGSQQCCVLTSCCLFSVCDLLWADPDKNVTGEPTEPNSSRLPATNWGIAGLQVSERITAA